MRDSKVSIMAANAQADAMGALLNGGYLRIYGSVKPADADVPETAEALAELNFQPVAFRPAENGEVVSYPLDPDTNTRGGGEATWFRAFTEDGRPVFDGTVGTAECDITLMNSAMVHPGGELHVSVIRYVIQRS